MPEYLDIGPPRDITSFSLWDLIVNRNTALDLELASWIPHWQELSERFCPRKGRYFKEDRNRGDRRHHNIIDNTSTRAARILAAGMVAGGTSPYRPWFELEAADPDLNDFLPVRIWLREVRDILMRLMRETNFYREAARIYFENGVFGTACTFARPHPKRLLHFYPVTIGEFKIAQNYESEVQVLYRQFQRTVAEVVATFPWERLSTSTRRLYQTGQLDQWVTILHAIEPRNARDRTKIDNRNMAFRSVYLEPEGEKDVILRESGFTHFPALVPRWDVDGQDVYGSSPGMESLGDVNALQHAWLRLSQVLDYKSKPPADLPAGMKNRDVDLKPGGKSYTPRNGGSSDGIRNALQYDLDYAGLQWLLEDIKRRVRDPFHADMFLMLYNTRFDPGQRTATEVAELHDEKLLMLGPALEQQQQDFQKPSVEMFYRAALTRGALPPAPPEVQGKPIEIRFVSTLAQAQQLAGIGNIDRYVSNILAIGAQVPDVLDTVDFDEWSSDTGRRLGVPPRMQRDIDAIAERREQRAATQKAAAQAEMIKTAGAGYANMAKARQLAGGEEDFLGLPQGALG